MEANQIRRDHMELRTDHLTLGYNDKIILNDINITLPKGKISILIGSNGCGKSTFLKSMARLLNPIKGEVLLEEKNIFTTSTKKVARMLSILPQNPYAPEDLTIFNLVKQGRYPYQSWLNQWSKEDENAINYALEKTGLLDIRDSRISDLSGGQKQRAWIAMTLAQQTDVILLDEPTNHLDVKYIIEVLDLLKSLNKTEKRTIIIVLHDINLASRYADHIIAIKQGTVYAQGTPKEIINEKLIKDVFSIDSKIITCPIFNSPLCIPYRNVNH